MDWQTKTRANARKGLFQVLGYGSVIFLILLAAGRMTNAAYMQDSLWSIFLVSVAIAPLPWALFEIVRSALKWRI
jgi:hypothetical protein